MFNQKRVDWLDCLSAFASSSKLMQTSKELLSQNEIKALLDVLSTPSQDNSSKSLGFEWGMAKVLNSIKSYFDALTLSFAEVIVSKDITLASDCYTYKTNYPFLESLRIDNVLALQIIAARFGANNTNIMHRSLSSLEESVLDDVFKDIIYIVEKELDTFLATSDEMPSPREISFYNNDVVQKLVFDFKNETVIKAIDLEQTVVEAVIGRLDVNVIEKGMHYKVEGLSNRGAILMFDKTLSFNALKSSRNSSSLSYVLLDAVVSTPFFTSYYVVVGNGVLDDEVYVSMTKGSVLKLSRFTEAEIHKDGRMVSKAKLKIKNNEMLIEIIQGENDVES